MLFEHHDRRCHRRRLDRPEASVCHDVACIQQDERVVIDDEGERRAMGHASAIKR